MARVGLLGGTFNPPHVGHMVCAMCARERLGLDVVRLVPAGVPPHKEVPEDPGVEVRLELCRLACAGDPGLEVSRVEADRPGRSFTVDTLRSLHALAPGDELIFLLGGDMAFSFPQWREPEAILELARLGIAERDEHRRHDLLERLCEHLPAARGRVDFFDMPRIDVSSSLLRRRVATGLPVRHFVRDAVADRIAELGLYGSASRVGEAAWA